MLRKSQCEVESVELHSPTRERWPCNTHGTSDEKRAMAADVWLEMLMLMLGGPEVLRQLRENHQQFRESGNLGRFTGARRDKYG